MPWLNAIKIPTPLVLESTMNKTVVHSGRMPLSLAALGSERPRGSGAISGTITINGTAQAGASLLLFSETRTYPVATGKTATNGSYSFVELPPGNYAVVVLDTNGNYRSKVIHTIVP